MLLVLEEKADACCYTQTGTNNNSFKCSNRPLIVSHHPRLYFLSFFELSELWCPSVNLNEEKLPSSSTVGCQTLLVALLLAIYFYFIYFFFFLSRIHQCCASGFSVRQKR